MTLDELLQVINENMVVVLNDAETQETLSIYDGTNSIDEQYNDYLVYDIVATAPGTLTIDIGE